MKNWYAVYTRSRHEKDVAAEVAGLGAELFLPLLSREQRWRDRRRTVEFPLFPSYLFLREDFADEESWKRRREVLKVKGVVRILSDKQGVPLPVPDQEILNIRTVLQRKLKVNPYEFEFYEGQPLRIRKGPLAGVEGFLVHRRGVHFLVLQVRLLHQAVIVTVSAADVEAVG